MAEYQKPRSFLRASQACRNRLKIFALSYDFERLSLGSEDTDCSEMEVDDGLISGDFSRVFKRAGERKRGASDDIQQALETTDCPPNKVVKMTQPLAHEAYDLVGQKVNPEGLGAGSPRLNVQEVPLLSRGSQKGLVSLCSVFPSARAQWTDNPIPQVPYVDLDPYRLQIRPRRQTGELMKPGFDNIYGGGQYLNRPPLLEENAVGNIFVGGYGHFIPSARWYKLLEVASPQQFVIEIAREVCWSPRCRFTATGIAWGSPGPLLICPLPETYREDVRALFRAYLASWRLEKYNPGTENLEKFQSDCPMAAQDFHEYDVIYDNYGNVVQGASRIGQVINYVIRK